MKPAARVGDMHVCPMVTGLVPHIGGPIMPPGCPTVLVSMMPAARLGDLATCVGPPDTIAMGSATVLIGNMPAARMGDNTLHGGMIVVGAPTVLIGEMGGFPGISVSGPPAFTAATMSALADIASTPTGLRLVQAIAATGKPVTIVPTTGGNSCGGFTRNALVTSSGTAGTGSPARVSFNPTASRIGTQPWQTRPPAIGLAHEMIHALHAGTGTVNMTKRRNDSKRDPATGGTQQAPVEELRTAGIPPHNRGITENGIRSEWPTPQSQRPHY